MPPFSLTLWAAESSYTQGAPVVGTAIPGEPTAGRLLTSGSQSASGDLELQIRSAGYAGRDSAALVWRNAGDSRWRGQDAPIAISGWESVVWLDGSLGALVSTANPHAVTLADGQVLVAYGYHATSPSTVYGVRTQRRAANGSSWASSVTVYSQTTDLTRGFHPCLLLLPSGRVLLFHGIEVSGYAQVQVWYSDDQGDTWNIHTTYALRASVALATYVPGRLRAAYDGRQIVLMIQVRNTDTGLGTNDSHDGIWQWASSDLAASFSPVQAAPSDAYNEAGSAPDILPLLGGGFFLAWACWTNSSPGYQLRAARIPNGYTDYRDVDLITPSPLILIGTNNQPTASSYEMALGDLAVTRDEAGNIWIYVQHGGPTPTWDGAVYLSADDGETIEDLGDEPFGSTSVTWSQTGDTATTPRRYSATWWRGAALILHQWQASPGNEDNSIGCMRLGGWSTLTMPLFGQQPWVRARPSWRRTWLPMDLPSDVGWTATGAGSETLTSGEMQVSTVASIRYYGISQTTGTIAQGIGVCAWVRPTSGGSLSAANIALNLRVDDGAASEDYEVTIRLTSTGYRVYDENAAATVGSDVSKDLSGGVTILVAINDGAVTVAHWVGAGSDRAFVVSHSAAALTDGGGSTLARRVRFGNIASATAESAWKMLHYTWGAQVGTSWATGQTSPDEQWPGPLCTRPGYIDDGVRVRGELGPFVVGDTFSIKARSDYPVQHLLYADKPSARRAYKAAGTTAQNIAWRLVDGYSTAGLQEAAIVLFLSGCNWRTGTLLRYRAGAWSTLASIDLATGLTSLPYTRTGNILHVNTAGSSTGPWYMHRNALIGATVDLGGGKLRKVVGNSDGMWTTGSGADMRRPRLVLTGVDDTEGTSGTCNIWMPGGAVVIHLAGTDAEAAGYKLTIDSQTIVDSAHTCKAHLGPLVTFVVQPDAQRTVGYRGNVEEVEYRDGTRRRVQRGPTRRSVTIGWQDQLVPEHHAKGASPAPSYAMGTSAANARALAALGAEPYTMAGLLEDLDGTALPVGYIGYVPRASTSPGVTHVLRPDLHLVGYITPEVRIEEGPMAARDTGGGPYAGNLTRIAELTIEDLP